MKTKHTPGPWKLKSSTIDFMHNGECADVCGANQVANAKLIAAAPDMLALLLKLEKAVRCEPFDDVLYKELVDLIKTTTK